MADPRRQETIDTLVRVRFEYFKGFSDIWERTNKYLMVANGAGALAIGNLVASASLDRTLAITLLASFLLFLIGLACSAVGIWVELQHLRANSRANDEALQRLSRGEISAEQARAAAVPDPDLHVRRQRYVTIGAIACLVLGLLLAAAAAVLRTFEKGATIAI
jgi:hypothetical protein